jgi:hypothetical protein
MTLTDEQREHALSSARRQLRNDPIASEQPIA